MVIKCSLVPVAQVSLIAGANADSDDYRAACGCEACGEISDTWQRDSHIWPYDGMLHALELSEKESPCML